MEIGIVYQLQKSPCQSCLITTVAQRFSEQWQGHCEHPPQTVTDRRMQAVLGNSKFLGLYGQGKNSRTFCTANICRSARAELQALAEFYD